MSSIKNWLTVFYFLRLILATPQLNLYYTDSIAINEQVVQHDCLRVSADKEATNDRQVVYYCMDEVLPTNNIDIEDSNLSKKFTFNDLSKQNITSEQLYRWSIPIDIIERYEIYLNNGLRSIGNELIYNCTWPRFGPKCQYDLQYYYYSNLTLSEMISSFKLVYRHQPTSFTCYVHLKCDRGTTTTVCLDWTEICDGKIDCLNHGLDEQDCWKLEVNECENDEYRCWNGQCIPKIFYQDQSQFDDCIDGTDERKIDLFINTHPRYYEQPAFGFDENLCEFGLFTRSCVTSRNNAIVQSIYSNRNYYPSEHCWLAYKHVWGLTNSIKFCEQDTCEEIIDDECPEILYFPSTTGVPDIYFGYEKDELLSLNLNLLYPSDFYVCSNKTYYNQAFSYLDRFLLPNDMECFHFLDFCYLGMDTTYDLEYCFKLLVHELHRFYTISNYNAEVYNRKNMYRCEDSEKYISFYRLHNGVCDCPDEDDESIHEPYSNNLTEYFQKYYFQCQNPKNMFIHPNFYRDGFCHCKEIEDQLCDDEIVPVRYLKRNISFQHICDDFTDIKSIVIDGRNETDETECDNWPCVNFNTHCDGISNCPRGIDETGCESSAILNCSENFQLCFSSVTHEFICLPVENVNDGYVDCVGGTDERLRCLRTGYTEGFTYQFNCFQLDGYHCVVESDLCDKTLDCFDGEDERFCTFNKSTEGLSSCSHQYHGNYSNYWKFMCDYLDMKATQVKQFILDGIDHLTTKEIPPQTQSYVRRQPDCHRGLFVRIWSNNSTTNTCLCPPAYYGNRCQYQNQRISLVIQFRALSDSWQTPFAIAVSLVDNSQQRLIHSYEQFTFLSIYDCRIKFNVYLFYARRPKDPTKNYSIHIDIYEKQTLNYRGSLYFPIEFSFLPVHRLPIIVNIPQKDIRPATCSNKQCIHGKCIYYLNQISKQSFCQCDPNWTGEDCSIPYQCTCSLSSRCIGISSDNRSICICPIDKFGPRCYIHIDCQSKCQNDGQCILSDDFLMLDRTYRCICKDGFTGEQCEIPNSKFSLSFEKHLDIEQSIYLHFIQLFNSTIEPLRSTTHRTAVIRPESLIIYWSQPFHLVFIQPTLSTYYLVLLQRNYQPSKETTKFITSSDRCLHINEIFNETFLQWHPIRRIKYYHLPCQANISCFYDDIHLCICDNLKQRRLANCLKFEHNMTFTCSDNNECLNNGQCFQDKPTCPSRFICICPACHYGQLCQFNTNEVGLSLDTILGYHILPQVNLTKQTLIVQLSFAISIIFLIIGLIDGILSLITFINKSICEVGCGFYLIGSSITTLFTMILFQLKILILILVQMKTITNDLFLLIQCHSLDYLLRFGLNMDQWINASIATERVYTIIQGVHFDKNKSRKLARIVLICLSIFNAVTIIHDPIHRSLVSEGNEHDEIRRTWCIIQYNSRISIYNYFINIVHLICPFMINLSCVIILIYKKSQQQLNVHNHLHFQFVLLQQFQEHKHILIAPIISILLALPRLIIIFITKCIKSPNDVWLPLIGYLISFIPTMLTFIIFVLPSKFYRKEFSKTIQKYRANLQRRVQKKSDI